MNQEENECHDQPQSKEVAFATQFCCILSQIYVPNICHSKGKRETLEKMKDSREAKKTCVLKKFLTRAEFSEMGKVFPTSTPF